MRILLVEDNKLEQLYAIATIVKAGHKVTVETDEKKILRNILKEKWDMVLTELKLENQFAFNLSKKLRYDFSSDALPIIGLTSNPNGDETKRCYDAGMQGFLLKPIVQEKLEEMINLYVKH